MASFLANGKKPRKFNFNLASHLVPEDMVTMEFYTVTAKRKREKKIAMFEIMLELLIDRKHLDLSGENLSDPNHFLLESTVNIKIYYTPPDIEERNAALGIGDDAELVDWRNMFDDEGRFGGHRHPHETSKKDNAL